MPRPWLVVVLVLASVSVAQARPRVALAAFKGDTKDHARRAVADVLEHDLSIVDKRETNHAMSDRELKRLSDELDVDAVVHGKLAKGDSGKVLELSLFVHGRKGAGFEVEYTSLTSKKFKTAVRKQLLARLDEAKTDAKAETKGEAKGEAKGEEKTDAKAEARAEGKPKRHARHDDDDDAPKAKRTAHRDEADADKDSDDAPGIAKTSSLLAPVAPGTDRAAVRVDAGVSVNSRVLSFSSRGFDQTPPSYRNAGVPGARVDGELYPLAFLSRTSPASGIGVAGTYDKTVGLSVANPAAFGSTLKVDQHQWSIGGRFRYAFGESPSPAVTFALDYGHRAFKVDRSTATIDMPDVDYKGVAPGLDVQVPLGHTFVLLAGGRAELLQSAGEIQAPEQYGRTHIIGGHGMVGVDVVLGSHMAVRLAGEAAMYKMTFYGTGAMTTSRDGDPTTQDVAGASDRYYGGSATIAAYY
jgi:hypothetical protein